MRKGLGKLNILVFGFLLFLVFQFTLLEGVQVTTTLETEGRNQSLNLRTSGHLANDTWKKI